jgi:hypothetical protein
MYGMVQKGSKKGYTGANMALVKPSLVDVARTEHSYCSGQKMLDFP